MLEVSFRVQWREMDDFGDEVWVTSGYWPLDLDDAREHARLQARTFTNVRIVKVMTEEVE